MEKSEGWRKARNVKRQHCDNEIPYLIYQGRKDFITEECNCIWVPKNECLPGSW